MKPIEGMTATKQAYRAQVVLPPKLAEDVREEATDRELPVSTVIRERVESRRWSRRKREGAP